MRTLDKKTVEALAEHLENAELERREVIKITDDYPDMTFTDATDVQWEIRRRKEARGHKIIGMKMGLTSWAKMAQMGVEKPCYGFLADYFSVPEGGEIPMSELIHPKVEAEFAGRAYAAYGGVYIVSSLAWLTFIERSRPLLSDFLGGAVCLIGAAIILFGPRLSSA